MTENSSTSSRRIASRSSSVDHESLNGPGLASSDVFGYKIVFHNHEGKKFAFPCEQSRTWDDVERLIRETYTRSDDNATKQEVFNGQFDLVNKHKETILPKVWPSFVRPGMHVHLSLWSRPRSQISCNSEIDYLEGTPGEVLLPDRYYDDDYQRPRTPRGEVVELEDEPEDTYSSDSETMAEEEEEDAENELLTPRAPRITLPPTGKNGEKLTIQVSTAWAKPPERHPKPAFPPSTVRKAMNKENFNILKAHLAVSQNRTILELHTVSGPQNSLVESSVSIRWYHLYDQDLDFSQFKEMCLGIPSLSLRLKALTAELLDHVEKQKVKPFVNGLYVLPGTVLRADEIHRMQKDNLAAIFSCVPYLEIQDAMASRGTMAPSYAPRSLMQSYYPLESTAERDQEQAYRKSNPNTTKIIYVPLMWMINIGPNIIATCGNKPLSQSLGKSVAFREAVMEVSEKGKNPSSQQSYSHLTVTVKLADWDGRCMLYTLDECSTYFELEQKLRELRLSARSYDTNSLQLCWINGKIAKPLTPRSWYDVFESLNLPTVNVSVLEKQEAAAFEKERQADALKFSKRRDSTPPFFHWPRPTRTRFSREDPPSKDGKVNTDDPRGAEPRTAMLKDHSERPSTSKHLLEKQEWHCLELVDRRFTSETLDAPAPYNVLEQDFLSTKYYTNLPESTLVQLRTKYEHLLSNGEQFGDKDNDHEQNCPRGSIGPSLTKHKKIMRDQTALLRSYSGDLVNSVENVLDYFVCDVSKSVVLRKAWGAAANMLQIIETRVKANKKSDRDHRASEPRTNARVWTIRSPAKTVEKGKFGALLEDDEFTRKISKCKVCRSSKPFYSMEDAKNHLANHLLGPRSDEEMGNPDNFDIHDKINLEDYIRHEDETLIEETNATYLAILSHGLEGVRTLLLQLDDIARGVETQKGTISDRYTLPPELLKSLRMCVVFFFAVERSVSHTDEMITKFPRLLMRNSRVRERGLPGDYKIPFSKEGFQVLDGFCDNAKMSLLQARKELCFMVRSDPQDDMMTRMSLGPEYVLGWCMRRLLVKPVEKGVRVADLYREYLSTLQFQVNHHPSKRLLRDINLLQEELNALDMVNSWQVNLIDNYAAVLNDISYESDIPARRTLFPYERNLLDSCLDSVLNDHDDYIQLTDRCGPLSESTKQSTEINEEDHGKAILVFTIITGIFLPLSFVTSYLGMNTSDIRGMTQKQSLFWEIAIPLTVVTLGTILVIAYNGDSIRDRFSALGDVSGKKCYKSGGSAFSRTKRLHPSDSDSDSTLARIRPAEDAEFAMPVPRAHINQSPRFGFQENELAPMSKPSAPHVLIEGRGRFPTTNHGVSRTRQLYSAPPPPPPHAPMGILGGEGMPFAYPNITKVSKRLVDVEKLAKLPWEYDPQDPNYYIILQPPDSVNPTGLYEHTSHLRGQRAIFPRNDDPHLPYDKYGKPEYAWVKKRRHGRDNKYYKEDKYDDGDDRYI